MKDGITGVDSRETIKSKNVTFEECAANYCGLHEKCRAFAYDFRNPSEQDNPDGTKYMGPCKTYLQSNGMAKEKLKYHIYCAKG